MIPKKNQDNSRPFVISLIRIVHGLLFLYALAIIGLVLGTGENASSWLTLERGFGCAVAVPVALGSFFCVLAATTRVMFGTAIFFCAFLTFSLLMLPLMTALLFPAHIVVFSLAAFYALSAALLTRFFFSQPVPKKK